MGLNISVLCEDGKILDPGGDIRVICTYVEDLDKIAKQKKLRPLLPYYLDHDEAMAKIGQIVYLDPKDAIATLEGIAAVLKDKPGAARHLTAEDVEAILYEVPEVVAQLKKAVKRKQHVRLLLA